MDVAVAGTFVVVIRGLFGLGVLDFV